MGKAPSTSAVVCRKHFEERDFIYPVYETLAWQDAAGYPATPRPSGTLGRDLGRQSPPFPSRWADENSMSRPPGPPARQPGVTRKTYRRSLRGVCKLHRQRKERMTKQKAKRDPEYLLPMRTAPESAMKEGSYVTVFVWPPN
ncbi:hypothetical protein HPB47_025732 [Ixodes persulcatus]|uniref:Uncharacterized protein n=1 Tax=Ixodes persulcatus TaxID=34615 RepID=A0AC60Q1Z6_IXOPE|nr:hypothetical protein HPB47_025732 [Ixodes persulcatus]